MWVRLLKAKALERAGKMHTFQPGDWYECGKAQAQVWIANGEAQAPGQNELKAFVGDVNMGILVIGNGQAATLGLDELSAKLSIEMADRPILPWDRTLIWNPAVVLQQRLVPTGFSLLETWDVAMPLWNYDELAANVGTAEERELTLAITHDLRVPLYDTRLLFVRRNERTIALLARWTEERQKGDDMRLSFLRALGRGPLNIMPLPVTWTGQQVMEG